MRDRKAVRKVSKKEMESCEGVVKFFTEMFDSEELVFSGSI